MNKFLEQYKKYFRNKYWIGISEMDGKSGFLITKGDGTRVHLVNPKSYVELFLETERIAKLEL